MQETNVQSKAYEEEAYGPTRYFLRRADEHELASVVGAKNVAAHDLFVIVDRKDGSVVDRMPFRGASELCHGLNDHEREKLATRRRRREVMA
jgi:hypothetical protein